MLLKILKHNTCPPLMGEDIKSSTDFAYTLSSAPAVHSGMLISISDKITKVH